MGGYNDHESLITRVENFGEGCLNDNYRPVETHALLREVLAVLEGRLMIDSNGMLHPPCPHKGKSLRVIMCADCGNVVGKYFKG